MPTVREYFVVTCVSNNFFVILHEKYNNYMKNKKAYLNQLRIEIVLRREIALHIQTVI